jgi:beta propeller repeat protein
VSRRLSSVVSALLVASALLFAVAAPAARAELSEYTVTGNTYHAPGASGPYAVWGQVQPGGYNDWPTDILGYDTATQTTFPICSESGAQLYPRVDGDVVVWSDFRGASLGTDLTGFTNIYAAIIDPVTLTTTEFVVGGWAKSPDVSGDIVVWTGSSGICAARIDRVAHTATEFAVSPDSPTSQWGTAAIDGTTVVWSEDKGTGSGYDIYRATIDPVGLTAAAPSAVCAATLDQKNPVVNGAWVAWEDDRRTSEQATPTVRARQTTSATVYGPFDGNIEERAPVLSSAYLMWYTGQPEYSTGTDQSAIRGFNLKTHGQFTVTSGGRVAEPGLGDQSVFWLRTIQYVKGARVFTVAPAVPKPSAVHVARRHTATLRYKVVDAESKYVTVTIKVTDSRGKTVKTLKVGRRKTNASLSTSFACSLPAKTYRFSVSAVDAMANLGVGSNKLVVH